jgi:hypothetical protein
MILDRSSGNFLTATGFNVVRSSGVYGTGTVIAVAIFSNTVVNTPGSMVQRQNSVVDLGLYAFEKSSAAGESSLPFTCSAGTGTWYAWELSAGSTYLTGQAGQNGAGAGSYALAGITPSAGARHLLAAVGGVGGNNTARSVSSVSDSFGIWGATQAQSQDWPFSAAADKDVTADGTTAYPMTGTFSGTSNTARGGISLAYMAATSVDTSPPTTPTGLAVSNLTGTGLTLNWSASSDNVGVAGYDVQIISL